MRSGVITDDGGKMSRIAAKMDLRTVGRRKVASTRTLEAKRTGMADEASWRIPLQSMLVCARSSEYFFRRGRRAGDTVIADSENPFDSLDECKRMDVPKGTLSCR